MYHKFLIGDNDRFDPANFPELPASLAAIVHQLQYEPGCPVADMVLSFVKDHSINSQLVRTYPRLATAISTKELPLGFLEAIFEASRKNPSFRSALETYVRKGLAAEAAGPSSGQASAFLSITAVTELGTVSIPVAHFHPLDVVTHEEIAFRVFRDEMRYQAIVLTSEAERKLTGLPEELVFAYANYVVPDANHTEDEVMTVIKAIILELQARDLI